MPDRDELAPPADAAELHAAIERSEADACSAWLDEASVIDAIHAITALTEQDLVALLSLLPADEAAELIGLLPEHQATEAVTLLDAVAAAEILHRMPSDERADLVGSLDDEAAGAILEHLESSTAEEVRRFVSYGDEVAGAIMISEFLVFQESTNVREILADLEANAEAYRSYDIQYTYIVDAEGVLQGVLPLRKLLLAPRAVAARDLMIGDPIRVPDTMPLDELRLVFREYSFLGLPVVDASGALIGLVERESVVQTQLDEADSLYRQTQGIVGGEELRSMPLLLRSRRRLAWLSTNIVLNIVAASMIAMHQDTLEAVIALAVFLPIISDMSGCSGNQAVAVTMRELTLGVTRPRDALRVLFKESSLGLINGCVLGTLIGLVAYAWQGNAYLGLVVGVSLAANTVIAVCIGGLVPLLLKRLKSDPALASGPILTTVTDMCGFFIVLTLASLMLAQLNPA